MKKSLLLFCLPLLLFGCSKKQQGDKYEFPRTYSLTSKMYDTDIFATQPSLFLVDSFAGTLSFRTQQDFMRFYSIAEGFREVGAYGSLGRGPLDFLSPEFSSVEGGDMFIYSQGDSQLARLRVADSGNGVEIRETWRRTFEFPGNEQFIDNVHQGVRAPFQRMRPFYPVRLSSGYFAGVSFDNSPEFFSLWDDDLNFVRFFGDAPIPEEIDEFVIRANRFQGRLQSHGNRLVFAAREFPYLALYEINDAEPVQKWAKYFLKPVYTVQDKKLILDGSKMFGETQNLSLGEDYIYLIFLDLIWDEIDFKISEQSNGNIVFVFDYAGNRVARLDLDRRVSQIAVSSDERTLYGITETEDGYRFVEFELPKFRE
ncbi:MAG: TolB-like 6-bladed beta-propeller domain-containing protein [Rikenellaceae bacterium]|nr:TolB-like 6-bladed beta-propeller domain-containing protein [Rikenellaceae bacterium]MCL2692618.1 TolB-like 6-bladed beta-propeller domain-containing protein [Rikenellaceae bacterium]